MNIKSQYFIDVNTSKGTLQLVAYTKHNGYYGGFELRVEYLYE